MYFLSFHLNNCILNENSFDENMDILKLDGGLLFFSNCQKIFLNSIIFMNNEIKRKILF